MGRRMSLAQERQAWAHFVETGEETLPPRNKFNAEKKAMNGRTFHSKMEAKRAEELQWQLHLGHISDLQYQVPYEVIPKQEGEAAAYYYADFVYKNSDGEIVVEDAKGHQTADYKLKRKLMLLVHGIRILETRASATPRKTRRSKR